MAVSLIVTLSPEHLLLIKLVVGKDQSYEQAGGGLHEREKHDTGLWGVCLLMLEAWCIYNISDW